MQVQLHAVSMFIVIYICFFINSRVSLLLHKLSQIISTLMYYLTTDFILQLMNSIYIFASNSNAYKIWFIL